MFTEVDSVAGAVCRRFEWASTTVEREPSRAIDEAGLILQLRKAKEKNSGALRKFRNSGPTVVEMGFFVEWQA